MNLSLNKGEAMGVVQHLDGISGTERQEVAFDYAQRLSDGIDSAIASISIKPFQTYFCHSRVSSIKHIRNFYLKMVNRFLTNIFVN